MSNCPEAPAAAQNRGLGPGSMELRADGPTDSPRQPDTVLSSSRVSPNENVGDAGERRGRQILDPQPLSEQVCTQSQNERSLVLIFGAALGLRKLLTTEANRSIPFHPRVGSRAPWTEPCPQLLGAGLEKSRIPGLMPSLLVISACQQHVVTKAHLTIVREEFQGITSPSCLGCVQALLCRALARPGQ